MDKPQRVCSSYVPYNHPLLPLTPTSPNSLPKAISHAFQLSSYTTKEMFPSAACVFIYPLAALAASAGASGKLSSLDGGLGGTVTVVNNTAIMIDGYMLKEASAPALYWWGSTTNDLPSGFRINNERVSMPASTDSIVIPLDAGKTASDFTVVGLWCEKLHANFGQATLDGKGSSKSSTTTGSSAAPSSTKQSDATTVTSVKTAALFALIGAFTIATQLI